MSCKYESICPSRSGWCEIIPKDYKECIPFILTAYTNLSNKVADLKLKKVLDEAETNDDIKYINGLIKELRQDIEGLKKELMMLL